MVRRWRVTVRMSAAKEVGNREGKDKEKNDGQGRYLTTGKASGCSPPPAEHARRGENMSSDTWPELLPPRPTNRRPLPLLLARALKPRRCGLNCCLSLFLFALCLFKLHTAQNLSSNLSQFHSPFSEIEFHILKLLSNSYSNSP